MQNDIIIKNFQLRAARSVLGIGVREIGGHIGLSGTAIFMWEHKGNFNNLKTTNSNLVLIKKFFEDRNLFFPDENSITLKENIEKNIEKDVLTRFQLRAARLALNVTQSDLADFIEVSRQVILRAEKLKNNQYIRPIEKEVPFKIKDWFEKNNVFFKDHFTVSLLENKNNLLK